MKKVTVKNISEMMVTLKSRTAKPISLGLDKSHTFETEANYEVYGESARVLSFSKLVSITTGKVSKEDDKPTDKPINDTKSAELEVANEEIRKAISTLKAEFKKVGTSKDRKLAIKQEIKELNSKISEK